MPNRALLTRITLSCLLAFVYSAAAFAQGESKAEEVRLPQGESIVAFQWVGSSAVAMVVDTKDGLAARWLNLDRFDFKELILPEQFRRLKRSDNGSYGLEFSFSPDGRALAILKRFSGPLKQNDLILLEVNEEGLVWLGTRSIPPTFWIDQLAWHEGGKAIYLSAEPYAKPEQEYSVGVFSLSDRSFTGLLKRTAADLLRGICYLNGRGMLALKCDGISGEYPQSSAILLFNTADGSSRVLHSEASELRPFATASGMLLLMSCDASGQLKGSGHWVLGPNENVLRPAEIQLERSSQQIDTSRDGRWIGISSRAGAEDEALYLAVQRSADGLSLLSDKPVASFSFSPDSSRVAAASADGKALLVYSLPAG